MSNPAGDKTLQQWLEHEIQIARNDGVTHPDNDPFLLTPKKPSNQAVLLIHGFSSSPREMLPLGKHLQQYNFTVAGVRLPGHGTTPRDLATRHAEDWLETVKRGYQQLVDAGLIVSVGGLSTGAVLSLNLALHAEPNKLLLLSPFLELSHPLAHFAKWLHYIIPYQNKNISEDEQPFYYQQRPLKGVAQIIRLCQKLEGQLNQIKVPSLILSSSGDRTIAPGTAQQIYQQLGSKNKIFHNYGKTVPHVLTTEKNPEQSNVFERCSSFLLAEQHSQD